MRDEGLRYQFRETLNSLPMIASLFNGYRLNSIIVIHSYESIRKNALLWNVFVIECGCY